MLRVVSDACKIYEFSIIIIIYPREKRKKLCLRFGNIHYATNLPYSKMAATLPVWYVFAHANSDDTTGLVQWCLSTLDLLSFRPAFMYLFKPNYGYQISSIFISSPDKGY